MSLGLVSPEGLPTALPVWPEAADVPFPRALDYPWMTIAEWARRHQVIVNDPARPKSELVFIGDSITEGWATHAPELWASRFGRYHPLNAGVGGDQTQHILWRVEHGALDGLPRAKAAIVLAGVNNLGLGQRSPAETARGVEALGVAVQRKLPGARVLVLGIFPADATPDEPRRRAIRSTNQALSSLLPARDLAFCDIGARFLDCNGALAESVMYDFLHPDRLGYAIWADALQELIPELMRR